MTEEAYTAEIELTARMCENRDWLVMRDLLIPSANGTCQIDFFLITESCLYVGEIKTFHGFIAGKGDRPYWKQYLSQYTYDYYNPSFQNRTHVKNLKRFLSTIPFLLHYHSIVYMLGLNGGQLKMFPPYLPSTSIVTDYDALERIIETIGKKKLMHIDRDQMQYIFDYVGNRQYRGQEARFQHIGYVHQVRTAQNIQLAQGLCPQCGGHLVQRQGKYGLFWGCSNYPRCKYTHQI